MSPAHTPGPWRVAEHTQMAVHVRVKIFDSDKATRSSLAQVYAAGMSPECLDECEANAALIAAAPDMAEALREIATCGATIVDGECTESRADRCRRVARAALAKAGL